MGPEPLPVYPCGLPVELRVESERDRHLREFDKEEGKEAGLREVRAPMPALVVSLEVSQGDRVTSGKGLIVLEAMKMENEIRAQHEGTVGEILVKEGDAVDKGDLLMRLE